MLLLIASISKRIRSDRRRLIYTVLFVCCGRTFSLKKQPSQRTDRENNNLVSVISHRVSHEYVKAICDTNAAVAYASCTTDGCNAVLTTPVTQSRRLCCPTSISINTDKQRRSGACDVPNPRTIETAMSPHTVQ